MKFTRFTNINFCFGVKFQIRQFKLIQNTRISSFNKNLSGEESEKENELENLRERNRQLALNLRDSQADLEGSERKNSILTG